MLVCFKLVLRFYPQILYSNLNSANTEKCDITFFGNIFETAILDHCDAHT